LSRITENYPPPARQANPEFSLRKAVTFFERLPVAGDALAGPAPSYTNDVQELTDLNNKYTQFAAEAN